MINGAPDTSFGNAGTLWSSVPSPDKLRSMDKEQAITHVGGTAMGVHLVGLDEAPAIVASTWAMPDTGLDFTWRSSPSVLFFPVSGAPNETGLSTGTLNQRLASAAVRAEPVASCPGQGASVCALVREAAPVVGPWSYFLRTASRTGIISQRPVDASSLFDPLANPPAGNVRIALSGGTAAIVSSERRRLRVTVLPEGSPPLTTTLSLAFRRPPVFDPLAGLVDLAVASVRFDGQRLSIALTAHRNDPVMGAVSQAVLLRLTVGNTIAADRAFGNDGMWVSPAADYRGFVTAAEVYGDRIAGVDGSRIVVFGLLADGSDLDATFGTNGVCTSDLGSPLTSPVATNDRDGSIYVFARRETDLRCIGCRVLVRTPLNPVASGTIDPSFGDGGTAILFLDGASATPAGIAAGSDYVVVGVTRGIQGIDCDRVPALVALNRADGRPNRGFGAGGFSLHAPAKAPAVLTSKGAAVFAGARFGANPPSLHFVNANATGDRTVLPALPATGPDIRSLIYLDDDSLLLGGRGEPGAVVKLRPNGSLVTTFGAGGLATVPDISNPNVSSSQVEPFGVRANGQIAVRCLGLPNKPAIGLLEPNGALDSTYNSSGSVPGLHDLDLPSGFGHRVFLQPDGSVICAFCDNDQIGLKRILPDGTTDKGFGMADGPVPAGGSTFPKGLRVAPPTALSVHGVSPVGFVQMGNKLYLIAASTIGGETSGTGVRRPAFDFLVVTRWNLDGSPDTRFGDGGLQYGGVSPELTNWNALGVLAESPSSVLVYGSASPIEVITSIHADGPTTSSTLIRNPQPALFRVGHPRGIDFRFGVEGAAIMRMQEFFPARFVAGVMLANGRVRLACTDTATHPNSDRPATTFGGLAQFE